MWTICICLAIIATATLGQRTWTRYQTSPMVITMDRNKFFWNTSFPSLTLCPHKRIDENKLKAYFQMNLEKFSSRESQNEFENFIKRLASLSFENIEDLPMNQTFGISSEDYLQLIVNLTWPFNPEISSGTTNKMYLQSTITELGFCYSVNSRVSVYNSYEYWAKNSWDIQTTNDTVVVHPLDGEIYAQIINLSTSYDVYFHGSQEVPDISLQKYTFPSTHYTTVELLALEIRTSEDAKQLSISQRKCRFTHEAEDMRSSPVYSFNLCHIECRYALSLRTCGCIPHFYRPFEKNGRKNKICDFDGLVCLVYVRHELISLKSDVLDIGCNCLPNCDNSNFFVQWFKSRVWFLGANLQWGINDYPKMQLRRELLFGFTDVLVYIGGIAGLFLGCSILSFTEIFYYFVWKMYKYVRSFRRH